MFDLGNSAANRELYSSILPHRVLLIQLMFQEVIVQITVDNNIVQS